MELKDLLSIGGKPGLYKLMTTSKTSIIVESLIDGKRIAVSGSSKISALEDISIFTYESDVPLGEVLSKIHDHTNGGAAPTKKASSQEMKDFIEAILPDYDQDRVYVSDLKKLFSWYNLLLENNLLMPTKPVKKAKAKAEKADSEEKEA
ncbi:MAG: DUF5606 domain-containing protein [Flavobacteriales bacterium]